MINDLGVCPFVSASPIDPSTTLGQTRDDIALR